MVSLRWSTFVSLNFWWWSVRMWSEVTSWFRSWWSWGGGYLSITCIQFISMLVTAPMFYGTLTSSSAGTMKLYRHFCGRTTAHAIMTLYHSLWAAADCSFLCHYIQTKNGPWLLTTLIVWYHFQCRPKSPNNGRTCPLPSSSHVTFVLVVAEDETVVDVPALSHSRSWPPFIRVLNHAMRWLQGHLSCHLVAKNLRNRLVWHPWRPPSSLQTPPHLHLGHRYVYFDARSTIFGRRNLTYRQTSCPAWKHGTVPCVYLPCRSLYLSCRTPLHTRVCATCHSVRSCTSFRRGGGLECLIGLHCAEQIQLFQVLWHDLSDTRQFSFLGDSYKSSKEVSSSVFLAPLLFQRHTRNMCSRNN